MNLSFWVILVLPLSIIYQQRIEIKVYFDGSAPDYSEIQKTCFVYSYIILAEDVKHVFFFSPP